MPDDLERRLGDALRAYADTVDVPEDDRLPVRPARPVARRWRGAVLAAAAVAAVVTGSVWVVGDRGDDATSAAGSAVSAEDGTSSAASASPDGATAESAQGLANSAVPADGFGLPASPEPGVAYPVDLYTHCGVRGIDVGGIWFAADPPLVVDYGPPPGWGNPDQRGTLTLLSATEAVFADDAGHEVRLRADESARPPLCD